MHECLHRVQAKSSINRAEILRGLRANILQGFWLLNDTVYIAGMTVQGAAMIYAASGTMPHILETLPKLERFYRARGGHSLTITGRSGWKRVLKACGYAPSALGITKELVL